MPTYCVFNLITFLQLGPWFYDNNTQSCLDAFLHGLIFKKKRNQNLGYLCVERYAKHDHPTWDHFQLVKCYHLNKVKINQINWKLQRAPNIIEWYTILLSLKVEGKWHCFIKMKSFKTLKTCITSEDWIHLLFLALGLNWSSNINVSFFLKNIYKLMTMCKVK